MVKKRPTQADVARVAGVSQATVSLVLNNPEAALDPNTRRRVLEAVAGLGYLPDASARSLRTRRTLAIASVIPDIANPFYPAFERGIQDTADLYGYDLIVYNTDGNEEKERRCLRGLMHHRVDGVIGVFFHLRVKDFAALLERGVPVVRLESARKSTGTLALDSVFVDNKAAAKAAVGYLLGRGHTRIGMIAGDRGPRWSRVMGYRSALAASGIAVDESLIRPCAYNETGGREGMRELLALPDPPSAVFAANDLIALGALDLLRERGKRVPEEVAVMGFDDIPVARLVHPALSTVSQFQERLGRRCAELMFERLGSSEPKPGRVEEMPFELVIRQSA